MNPEALFRNFDLLAEAPDFARRMRELVLALGLNGSIAGLRSDKWERVTLGTLGEWGSGGTPLRSEPRYYGGSIPWLVIGDLNDGLVTTATTFLTEEGLANSSAKLLPKGVLLIAMYGSIGKMGITGIECATNQAIAFCNPRPERVDLRYLFHTVKALQPALLARGQGLAQKNISQTILKAWEISLPSLAEQKAIAAKVDELMTLCDKLEEQQRHRKAQEAALARASVARFAKASTKENLEFLFHNLYSISPADLRNSILTLAVRGKLVPQYPDDEPADVLLDRMEHYKAESARSDPTRGFKKSPTVQKDDVPSELPSSWRWARTESICAVIVDCPHSTPAFVATGIVCLDTNCFKDGRLIPHKIRFVTEETYKERIRRLAPKAGDVVFAREGSVGASVVVPEGMRCCLGQRVMLFRLMPGVLPQFFRLAISESASLERLLTLHKGIGAKHVNVGDMRNALIPIPPLNEQVRILTKVDEMMSLVDTLERQLVNAHGTSANLLEVAVNELA